MTSGTYQNTRRSRVPTCVCPPEASRQVQDQVPRWRVASWHASFAGNHPRWLRLRSYQPSRDKVNLLQGIIGVLEERIESPLQTRHPDVSWQPETQTAQHSTAQHSTAPKFYKQKFTKSPLFLYLKNDLLSSVQTFNLGGIYLSFPDESSRASAGAAVRKCTTHCPF